MVFEMYKSSKRKMSEEQYKLLKKYYLDEKSGMIIDYKLVREIIFSGSGEFIIRTEQMNPGQIYVIKKSKWNGITYESSNVIEEDECRKLLQGDILWMDDEKRPLVHNLYLQMKYNKAKPKLMREYVEETCVQKEGREKAVFTYGASYSKKNAGSFLDADVKMEHCNNSITADIQTQVTVPSFLLQLM